MSEQRIYFNDENKLVIETNNCKNIDGELRTKVDGIFYADGETVAKLFSLINKENYSYPHSICIQGTFTSYYELVNELLVIDDNCASVIELQEKNIKELEQDKKELEQDKIKLNTALKTQADTLLDLSNKLVELGNKITKFNDTRHWWERKIKID